MAITLVGVIVVRLLHYVYCITGGDRKNGNLQSLSDYDMGFGWNLTLFALTVVVRIAAVLQRY